MSNMKFDEQQQKVIEIDSGYNLVLAPPGCGKTAILAERISRAYQNGVAYEDMMCLTFTNRASKGMRERIEERTNNPVPPELFVGNLHRFCSQFLFTNNVVSQNAPILDEIDTLSVLMEIANCDLDVNNISWEDSEEFKEISKMQHMCRQLQLGQTEELWLYPNEYIKLENLILDCDEYGEYVKLYILNILEIIENKLKEGLQYTISELKDHISQKLNIVLENDNTLELLFKAVKYVIYKEDNNGMLDFDDLLIETYNELRTNNEKYHKYKWIQIDEVQDLNRLQFAIVDLLTDKDNSVVVYLGDEQQSIFSFMGAKVETLKWLKDRCNNKYFLGKNYRSPKYLLDIYNTYAKDLLHIDEDLLPTTDNDIEYQERDLYCASLSNNNEANDKIAKLAVGYNKIDDETVAILVPTNKEADEISESLRDMGQEHFKISGKDIFSSKELRIILAHLNIIQNEISFIQWAKLLYHLGIVPMYSEAREYMRQMRNIALLPNDLFSSRKKSYLTDFLECYENEEIVLFDTETTGLDIFNDDIVQIAAIKVRNGKKVPCSEFEIYMESEKPLPPIIAGKPNPMIDVMENVKREGRTVTLQTGLDKFMEYCKGSVLVAHNITYDYNILKYNLKRYLPDVDIKSYCPQYFDTLKLTRLLEPRLKVYKLEKLLDNLKLEGINSHNAIDDVNATLNLLTYCCNKGKQIHHKHLEFLSDPKVQEMSVRLSDEYESLYRDGCNRLYQRGYNENPILVEEMQKVYDHYLRRGKIESVDKWQHIKRYFSQDVINADKYSTLTEQLDAYITIINTTKEADMCSSHSMTEKFFISTVHKAKGLEFDNVIVTSCIRDVYPSYRRYGKIGKLTDYDNIVDKVGYNEDARKLYVAISRAKKRLCLVWYKQKVVYSEIWNKFYHFNTKITPFIEPIKDYFAGTIE